MILSGDVGGTYTRLALFDGKEVSVEKALNATGISFEEIVLRFLEKHKVPVKAACFAVAGPIQNGRCAMTNHNWTLDAAYLSKKLAIPCGLMNDLEAHAVGVQFLQPKDVQVLQIGKQQEGNQALVFSGTGLGEAGIFFDGISRHPWASEGGHADFAPRNEQEIELFRFFQKKYGHVSVERVLSGHGLGEMGEFLKRDGTDLFLSLLGAEAGNVALKYLSLGGLYIGGGVALMLKDRFEGSSFISSFVSKGRFQKLLESIPVSLVLTDNTALWGAAQKAIGLK